MFRHKNAKWDGCQRDSIFNRPILMVCIEEEQVIQGH